jgi:hypothetical protein
VLRLVQHSLEHRTPKKPELFAHLVVWNLPFSCELNNRFCIDLQVKRKLVERHQSDIIRQGYALW